MSNLTRALLVLVVLTTASAGARAESLSFSYTDTGSQGSVTHNADGSFLLHTNDDSSDGKASVVFGKGFNVSLGKLADITGFSADFLKISSTTNPANNLAIRLWTNATGTEGLVWENNYNGNDPVTLNAWDTIDLSSGLFWQRANHTNFDTDDNFKSLSDWAGGFTPSGGKNLNSPAADIYAIQVSYGSGVGPFDGSVRNVNLSFGSTQYTAAEFREEAAATPLPSAALGGLACLGLFATSRFRRRPVAV